VVLTTAPAGAQTPVDPASVLIVVNDNTPPEPGTGAMPAGQYVAGHYAAARGIPSGNVVHVRTNPACLDTPSAWDCWNIRWADFVTNLREPIRAFLGATNLTRKITYIVPTYGVPSHINDHPRGVSGLSLDSFLATMNTPVADSLFVWNPSYDPNPTSTRPLTYSSFRSLYYAVVRLDGPSAQIAAGLVDKALAAEQGISRRSGFGYFDQLPAQ
jgi:uncharacterized protein (TIGR03790 family)